MTLNKTAIAAIISLAALTGFSGVASAQNTMPAGQQAQSTNQGMDNGYHMNNARHQGMDNGYHKNMSRHQGGRMANLTPEQQATTQKAFDEFEAKTADLRKQMVSKNYEYKALLTAGTVDDKKVEAVSKEITALRDQIAEQRVQLDIQLAKAGIPMMGHRGMGNHMGMNGNGMSGGRGCR